MNRMQARTWLAGVLGVVFILMGIAEVTVRIVQGTSSGLAFWFLSLCGGGTMILIGTFAIPQRRRSALVLVLVGCLAATVATMWTLVLPVFTLALVILTLLQHADESGLVES